MSELHPLNSTHSAAFLLDGLLGKLAEAGEE